MLLGRVLDKRYRLDVELGEGGVGRVYRAEHLKLGRDVAVKVLLPEFARDEHLRQRFDREARALAAMSHRNVVAVTDFGIAEGVPYLVMELLEGRTLEEVLFNDGALSTTRALAVLRQVLDALAFAHGEGLIHRDLKPSNIMLIEGAEDEVRLLDFGLAKFTEPDPVKSGPALTRTGMIFGTPAYMAPEQAVGSNTDTRTDVYAVGLIAFEMLTGGRPFSGETSDLLKAHLTEPVPALSSRIEGPVPSELEAFVARASAKEPADRFQDAAEMLAALDALPPMSVASAGAGAARPSMGVGMAPTLPASAEIAVQLKGQEPRRKGRALLSITIVGALAVGGAVLAMSTDDAAPVAEASNPRGEEATDVVSRPRARRRDVEREASKDSAESPSILGKVLAAVGSTEEAAPEESADHANPWSKRASKTLRQLNKKTLGGRELTANQEKTLRRMGMRERDARALLVLARGYLNKGWKSDAIATYERAVAMDEAMKGDIRMRRDLEEMAKDGKTATTARRALRTIYGE